jgi:hypothetical protein
MEYRCNCTLSLTLALYGVDGKRHASTSVHKDRLCITHSERDGRWLRKEGGTKVNRGMGWVTQLLERERQVIVNTLPSSG